MPRELLSDRARRELAFIALAATLAGCSATGSAALADTTDAPAFSAQQAVLNGEVSPPDEDAVVEVVSKTDTVTHTCTGTLLAPNLVITAHHCVAKFVDTTFTCTSSGELVPGSPGGKIGALLDPSEITIHVHSKPSNTAAATATKIFAAQDTTICRNDIALIVLDTALTDLPISAVRLGAGNSIGEQLRVVGYGVDETQTIGTRHTLSGLTISQIGTSEFRPTGDAVPPRTFVTEGPALCIGDSGGPAFTDQSAVTGVWSQVVGDCTASTARNYFTQVAPFEDELIKPAFAEAGAEPWLEGTSGPGITPGSAGAPGDAGSANASGGSASASGGSDSSGGTDASGGTSLALGGTSDETGGTTVEYHGLRKKGGCTCTVVGARGHHTAVWSAPLLGLALLLRRRKERR